MIIFMVVFICTVWDRRLHFAAKSQLTANQILISGKENTFIPFWEEIN